MNVHTSNRFRHIAVAPAALATVVVLTMLSPGIAHASGSSTTRDDSLTLNGFLRVLTLTDYNTRVVVLGTTLLGIAAGVVGTFAYLRKRALMGDALSHATLPGIAAAFLIIGDKQLSVLMLGATLSGILGVLAVIAIRNYSRIREDAAIGIVLSVFFGAGMVLFSIIQQLKTGNEAGLATFIYGKAAAMLHRDALLTGATALAVVIGTVLLFKEFRIVCFDPQYAASQGWPVVWVDLLMMGLVVLTTVIGLQAVGLILVVALLIIPAAAARFWTDRLSTMVILAGALGAASGWLGSTLSALAPRLPTGAVIVICAGAFFFISMAFAPRRGLVAGIIRRSQLNRKVAYQNLLRAFAELEESNGDNASATFDQLLHARGWTPAILRRAVRNATRRNIIRVAAGKALRLTKVGRAESRRILRNHRLWEIYLINYADIAPSHVDRDADEVEHILSNGLIAELEKQLAAETHIPPSPHRPEASTS